ncbi:phosphatase [Nitrosophilus kaiyonis]|uniref:Ppx/GppA phosphatase family protein n=1 Tax=Nitrosophilus kaiyonis TaxID=2930200 RepID=UPI00249297D9|nr:phosphatase [Nitrosophilus kaiyonis]
MIAIDIGSNSLRAIQIDCYSLDKIFEYEKVVQTADNLEKSSEISKEALDRIAKAIKEIQKRIDFSKESVKAVATAAFRKAKNQKEAIEYIKEKTGIDIEVIDPDMEGFYSAVAVEHLLSRLGLNSEKFLMCDIGGASVEFVIKNKEEIVTKSFDFGIVTIAQRFKTKENIVFGIKKYMEEIKIFLNDTYEIFGKPKRFVATGGTPTTIAAIKKNLDYQNYNSDIVNGTVLFPTDIDNALNKLLKLSSSERAKLVGKGREDFIIPGVLILKEIMKTADFDEVLVSDEGVREGVALIGCKKILSK